MYLIQHLNAGNDTNGNPRRCFLVYNDQGTTVECIDEGYRGEAAWRKSYPTAVYLGLLRTTATQIRELHKLFPEKSNWHLVFGMGSRKVLAVFGAALEKDAIGRAAAIEEASGRVERISVAHVRALKPHVGDNVDDYLNPK